MQKLSIPEQHILSHIFFNQSSGDTAYAEDALNAHHMNANYGEKQTKRRDTSWYRQKQLMTTASGLPKGLRNAIEERGVHTKGMVKNDMVKVLEEMHDFKTEDQSRRVDCTTWSQVHFFPQISL